MIRTLVGMILLLFSAYAAEAATRNGLVLCPDHAENQPHPCGENRNYLGRGSLDVIWDGERITFHKEIRRFTTRYRLGVGGRLFDCAYKGQKTRCFEGGKSSRSWVGGGIKYTSPIAAEIPTKSTA